MAKYFMGAFGMAKAWMGGGIFGGLLVIGLGVGEVVGQTSVTEPVGFLRVQLKGSEASTGLNLLGPPFVNRAEYQGVLESAAPGTLTDSDAAWGIDPVPQFRPNPAVVSHYVEIVAASDAALVGKWANILGNTATTLSIDADWSGRVAGDETFVIRRHRTVSDIFGTVNESGLGSGTVLSADTFATFDPVNKAYTTFYYKTEGFGGTGWRTTSNPISDQAAAPISPVSGLYLRRRQGEDLEVILSGYLKPGPLQIDLKEGLNLVNPQTPLTDQAVQNGFGENFTLGNTGTADSIASGLDDVFAAGDLLNADTLAVFDPGSSQYTTYYRKQGGFGGDGWRTTSNPFTARESTILPAATGFFVRMNSGTATWVRPQTFTQLPF